MYKHTYKVDMFSLDILSEAIADYMSGKPKPTFEQELQWKLERARKDIWYNETYETPTWETVEDGDELEIMTSYGWTKGLFPEVLYLDTHVNLFCKDQSVKGRFHCATLRRKKKK